MTKKISDDQAYEKISDAAKFREQYRFIFSGAVIATVFIVPDGGATGSFFKWMLVAAAILSAAYLVLTAATVKYSEPRVIYQVFDVSERFRMRMFDWSIDVFGAAFLLFISVLTVGLIQLATGINFGGVWQWIAIALVMLFIGFAVLIGVKFVKRRGDGRSKKLPLI